MGSFRSLGSFLELVEEFEKAVREREKVLGDPRAYPLMRQQAREAYENAKNTLLLAIMDLY